MDIKNAIDDIAKVLEPYATIIYVVGVAGTCVLASWAFLSRKLSTKDAKIRELDNTVKYLRGENSRAQNSIKELKKALDKARDGLPEVALKRAEQQVRDGNEENANQILMEWFRQEAESITEVSRRLACWELSFSQHEQHGGAAVLGAERLITIACALQPKDRQLRNLKDEILISKYKQDPAGTADELWNRMRSLADEYDNADPAILNKYADKYYEAGKYHCALALCQRMTVILRRTAGPNDRNTLRSQGNQARILYALSRFEESEALQRETWDARKEYLPPNDRDTLESQGQLASVLRDLDHFEESEALQREAWEAMKKYLPPNDRDTLRSQHNLAAVLSSLKRLEESEKLYRETWEARKEHLPPNDRSTLTSQSNLASVLHDLKRLEESEALHRKTWEARKEHLGLNHRDTLTSQNNLASVLHDLNRLEESEALHRETWEAMKKHLGPNDRETLRSQHNLAVVLCELNRLEESEALQRETWEAMKEHLGPNDRDTLISQHNLAPVLRALNRPEEAEALATATAMPGDDAGESEAQPRLSGDSRQSVLPVGLQLY